ncbi:MAG: RNase adapter RapZ [Erysipelotrichaceae bacterium]
MDRKRQLVLISGRSGAGKSSAMHTFEDLGYTCLDNFPLELVDDLGRLLMGEDNKYQNVALACSASDFYLVNQHMSKIPVNIRRLILDAQDEKLITRYQFTRREHPLLINNVVSSLIDAIEYEKELLTKMTGNSIMIDTTFISEKELKKKIQEIFYIDNRKGFSINFTSFGYKKGLPLDADLVIDVRFLINPYWNKELRHISGLEDSVYDYVISNEDTIKYLETLTQYLDFTFEAFNTENKKYMMVAIGCTGGMHRSVSVARYLADKYSEKYHTFISHRELGD